MNADRPYRLAIIVGVDVAGYSARTEADGVKSAREVVSLRDRARAIAEKLGGRIFNTAGDGIMIEFPSAREALLGIGALLDERPEGEPQVRVGAHLGDVTVTENGDLLGHGVNVAARLMTAARPSHAMISMELKTAVGASSKRAMRALGEIALEKMSATITAFEIAPRRTRSSRSAATPVKTADADPSMLLAVLPFDNLSADPDMQFFSDGVSDEILNRLSRGLRYRVIGRSSSFQFRGARKGDAARELRATHILDGSTQRSAGRIRVSAFLIDARTHLTLWSERYDRVLEDIFVVQDEIAASIAAALDSPLRGPSTTPIDPAAYDLFLRAKAREFSPEGTQRSIQLLEQVTRAAPEFAPAWGSLASHRAFLRLFSPLSERKRIGDSVLEALRRCRQRDPENPDALVAEYRMLDPFGDYLAQDRVASRMSNGDSSGLRFLAAYHLETVGRVHEAVRLAEQARELDPKDGSTAPLYGMTLWHSGRAEEGRAIMEQDLHAWPDNHWLAASLILCIADLGDWAAVDRLIAPEQLSVHPLRELELTVNLGILRRNSSLAAREAAFAQLAVRIKQDHAEAPWGARLGFTNETYDILDANPLGPKGSDVHVGVTPYRSQPLFVSGFEEFRCTPRFARLCARLGLAEYWLQSDDWPDCVDDIAPYYDLKAACRDQRSKTPIERFPG